MYTTDQIINFVKVNKINNTDLVIVSMYLLNSNNDKKNLGKLV